LVEKFISEFGIQFGKSCLGVTPDFISRLMAYNWPGNIRELRHVLCRSILLEDDPVLSGRYFDSDGRVLIPAEEGAEKNTERRTLIHVLERVNQNRSKAAKELGISRKTLYDRMKRHKIGPRAYKTAG
jgi:transcriptional regulator of acetoin/glycerol metabolism